MHICLVTTEYPPLPMGGVGTYCMILPKLLMAEGHRVTIVTKYLDQYPAKCEETFNNGRILRIQYTNKKTGIDARKDYDLFAIEMLNIRHYCGLFAHAVMDQLPQIHSEDPIDIILSQDVEAPTFLFQDSQLLYQIMPEVPVIVFVHGTHHQVQRYNDDPIYHPQEFHRILYEKQSISMAHGRIVPSQFITENYKLKRDF